MTEHHKLSKLLYEAECLFYDTEAHKHICKEAYIADYLLKNNVLVLPYKPFPVVQSEDENNSDVFCPFCDTDLSGHYYGGDYETPKIVACFGCGTWLDGTKAITKEEAQAKLKEGGEG
jgi:hypothetical protein